MILTSPPHAINLHPQRLATLTRPIQILCQFLQGIYIDIYGIYIGSVISVCGVCTCVWVLVYLYVYVYIYMYLYMYVYVHVWMCMCVCIPHPSQSFPILSLHHSLHTLTTANLHTQCNTVGDHCSYAIPPPPSLPFPPLVTSTF